MIGKQAAHGFSFLEKRCKHGDFKVAPAASLGTVPDLGLERGPGLPRDT